MDKSETQSVVDPHARIERCAEVISKRDTYRYTYRYSGRGSGRGSGGFSLHYDTMRCRRWAQAGSDYCWQHKKWHKEKEELA